MIRDSCLVTQKPGQAVRPLLHGGWRSGRVHTNGVESFWAMFKRGFHGTYHRMSVAHLGRYVNEFAGHHNMRSLDTLDQLADMAYDLIGKRFWYKDLTA